MKRAILSLLILAAIGCGDDGVRTMAGKWRDGTTALAMDTSGEYVLSVGDPAVGVQLESGDWTLVPGSVTFTPIMRSCPGDKAARTLPVAFDGPFLLLGGGDAVQVFGPSDAPVLRGDSPVGCYDGGAFAEYPLGP